VVGSGSVRFGILGQHGPKPCHTPGSVVTPGRVCDTGQRPRRAASCRGSLSRRAKSPAASVPCSVTTVAGCSDRDQQIGLSTEGTRAADQAGPARPLLVSVPRPHRGGQDPNLVAGGNSTREGAGPAAVFGGAQRVSIFLLSRRTLLRRRRYPAARTADQLVKPRDGRPRPGATDRSARPGRVVLPTRTRPEAEPARADSDVEGRSNRYGRSVQSHFCGPRGRRTGQGAGPVELRLGRRGAATSMVRVGDRA